MDYLWAFRKVWEAKATFLFTYNCNTLIQILKVFSVCKSTLQICTFFFLPEEFKPPNSYQTVSRGSLYLIHYISTQSTTLIVYICVYKFKIGLCIPNKQNWCNFNNTKFYSWGWQMTAASIDKLFMDFILLTKQWQNPKSQRNTPKITIFYKESLLKP